MSSEKMRRDTFDAGPDAFSDDFASTAVAAEGAVHVIHGVYAHSMPLAGMTVRRARGELEERMNLDPDAVAVVDGNEVDEETILQENQTLTFVKHAGEKG
jgi:hypothetical protein